LSNASRKPRTFRRMQTSIHEPQLRATGHKLHAAFSRLPGRGWPRQPRSGVHAGKGTGVWLPQVLGRRGGSSPSPTGQEPKAEHGDSTGHKPHATGHPSAPSPRTTHHVTTGRTRGSAITHTTRHGPEITGHKLRATSLFWFWTPALAGVTGEADRGGGIVSDVFGLCP